MVRPVDLAPEDFDTLMAIGILAPTSLSTITRALRADEASVSHSVDRLVKARLVIVVDGQLAMTAIGHENLSRRKLRRVRDITRMLYLWRSSRGNR